MLQIFQIEAVDIVGSLLDHNGTGGVMGSDAYGSVLHAGFRYDLHDLFGHIVESGDPASGFQFQFLLHYFKFHVKILLYENDKIESLALCIWKFCRKLPSCILLYQ